MYFRRYDLGVKDSVDATAFAHSEKKKPITNADHIRAMTDEELAGFISAMSSCNGCKAKSSETAHPCKGLYEGCKGNWLDWLRQEVRVMDEVAE